MNERLTPLEEEAVSLVALDNWPGFNVSGLRVTRREDTGAGRYVYLEDSLGQTLTDGTFSSHGRMIEMAGVQNGLGFVVDVTSARVNYIEFFTFGNDGWDGVEREWKIV